MAGAWLCDRGQALGTAGWVSCRLGSRDALECFAGALRSTALARRDRAQAPGLWRATWARPLVIGAGRGYGES
jgi:hypothetical protein